MKLFANNSLWRNYIIYRIYERTNSHITLRESIRAACPRPKMKYLRHFRRMMSTYEFRECGSNGNLSIIRHRLHCPWFGSDNYISNFFYDAMSIDIMLWIPFQKYASNDIVFRDELNLYIKHLSHYRWWYFIEKIIINEAEPKCVK